MIIGLFVRPIHSVKDVLKRVFPVMILLVIGIVLMRVKSVIKVGKVIFVSVQYVLQDARTVNVESLVNVFVMLDMKEKFVKSVKLDRDAFMASVTSPTNVSVMLAGEASTVIKI